MSLNSIWYITKETGRNLVYNTWMTLASVSTVAISMFVLSFFLVLTVNMTHVTNVLQSQVEMRVFIKSNVPRAKEIALLQQVRHWQGVKKVQFFTKQEAAATLKKEFPNQKDLLTLISKSNPLFDGFNVYTKVPSQIPGLAKRFKQNKIVHSVVYEGQVVNRLSRLSVVLKWVGWGIELLLGLATLFIIVNTIRLAVFARRREIGVMKLVGATDWFIRWPFILEGLILGLVGAVVAEIVVGQGYHWLLIEASNALPFWPMAPFHQVMAKTVDVTLLGGLVVGGVASLVVLRRFLRV